jgi:Ser/Thr protein kinase RdoA (MazF antagonist)
VLDHFESDLRVVGEQHLSSNEVEALSRLIEGDLKALGDGDARLAHGDFDASQIFQDGGQYTGLIDFGEVRGAHPLYDLGHFRCHEDEILGPGASDSLLDGYSEVTALPADAMRQIVVISLIIGLRRLARSLRRHPDWPAYHRTRVAAIRRDLAYVGG